MSAEPSELRIRVPHALRQAVEASARASARTVTAEVISRLEQSFEPKLHDAEREIKNTLLETLSKMLLNYEKTILVVSSVATASMRQYQSLAHRAAHLDQPFTELEAKQLLDIAKSFDGLIKATEENGRDISEKWQKFPPQE